MPKLLPRASKVPPEKPSSHLHFVRLDLQGLPLALGGHHRAGHRHRSAHAPAPGRGLEPRRLLGDHNLEKRGEERNGDVAVWGVGLASSEGVSVVVSPVSSGGTKGIDGGTAAKGFAPALSAFRGDESPRGKRPMPASRTPGAQRVKGGERGLRGSRIPGEKGGRVIALGPRAQPGLP